ncbi:hypothetical protein MHM98_01535 [Psychrobium sp. MM17-31]|uniref:hypothetical protein n=1 Tax=Psychrobium sp. MM17-31 TaxID=2917758 RepID=UPI001EF547E6|nr:hypothetical protein [Psychrobium sp. MM17-31]MCG7530045.1 hypothetical protein [Psychrobium sp. MM17-31]
MQRLTNLLKQPRSHARSVIDVVKAIHRGFWRHINTLNTAQKLYIIALALLTIPDTNWVLVCLFTSTALGLEFWPRFTKIWHSLLGKSFLLFFYAIIANFALASAASIVNEVSGVAADHLPYTHNFVILMYLPVWIIGFTLLGLLILQVLSPIYILAIILLRPFGIRAVKILSQSRFPVLTTIVRMILSLVLLVQLMALNEKNVIEMSDELNQAIENVVKEREAELKPDELAALKVQQEEPVVNNNNKNDEDDFETQAFGIRFNTDDKEKQRSIYYSYRNIVLLGLNKFIYALEADNFSRCHFNDPTRVVELNDYEMLTVTPSQDAQYGYHYQVLPCKSIGVPGQMSKN